MADDYFSWTVTLPEAEIPADLAPADDFLPDVISDAMGRPGALMTLSRKNWLHGALGNVFSEFGGSALAFLVKDPESLPGDRVTGFRPVGVGNLRVQERWLITALPHSGIPGAMAEIDSWLATATEQPERFVTPLVAGGVDHIAKETRTADVLTEDRGKHLEGDRPAYFFWFLKALRKVLLDTQAPRMAVLHVRYVYLWRRQAEI